jgi:hypothetical protein
MKKAYTAPILIVYGDVVALTQGLGTGSGKDTYTGFPINPGNPGFKGPGSLSSK